MGVRPLVLLAPLAVVAGSLAGCGDDDASSRPAQETNRVSVEKNLYIPANIVIDAGTTVTWTFNDGTVPHTVTARDRSFNSGKPQAKGTFRYTFEKKGTVPYYCEVHPAVQKGTVEVR